MCTTLHLAYFHFQYAADVRVPDLNEVYKEGQAVVAKVIEVDKEKKRFLASLRMLDCYHGDTDVGIQITEHYLAEKQLLLKKLENSGFTCYIFSSTFAYVRKAVSSGNKVLSYMTT